MKKSTKVATAILITATLTMLYSSPLFAAYPVLKLDSKGSEVTTLQKNLARLGYLNCQPTGHFGPLTKSAVISFQKDNGLVVDGIAGKATLSRIEKLLGSSSSSGGSSAKIAPGVYKVGSRGSAVTALQNSLVKLGYLSVKPTGYYGTATKEAVKKFQKAYGLSVDGIAGNATISKINSLISANGAAVSTTAASGSTLAARSGSTSDREVNYKLAWFNNVENIFKRGMTATVYDIKTGKSFNIKRTYGTNHADCETLTKNDTAIMKSIYGGSWSWERRAVIVTVGDIKIAASMAGMPHAGVDKYPANKVVSSRSGGYGRGQNLDAVKGNNMDGVFDLHFYNSRTHGSNKVDSKHQSMIKEAEKWAKKNL